VDISVELVAIFMFTFDIAFCSVWV